MFDALATWLIYDLAGLKGTPSGDALHFFVMDVTKILVLLTLVIYLMGLLRALLKPEKVREFIRNRGNLQSRVMAVGLGAVTPFGGVAFIAGWACLAFATWRSAGVATR